MKTKLILTLLIGISTLSFSQNSSNIDRNKLRNYYLINKFNDTTQVYSETMKIEELHCGFDLYDKNGHSTNLSVNPELCKYLLFINSNGRTVKLKSVPVKKRIRGCLKKSVFMLVLIENSDQDFKNGKVDFYSHKYTHMDRYKFGAHEYAEIGVRRVSSEIYYFKDLNGLHQISFKYQFERFPKILGKKLYKKMIQSDKGEKQFLLDYFTEYNENITTVANK